MYFADVSFNCCYVILDLVYFDIYFSILLVRDHLKNKANWWEYQPTPKLCIHFVYKNCTRCIQLMYAKCTQNVYKMYPIFRHYIYILYTKLKELLQLNFVYKMYTKVCWNVGNILYTFCIHQFWSTKSIHHKKLWIQFVYKIQTECIYK